MLKQNILMLFLCLGLISAPEPLRADEGLIRPDKGTVYYALLEGLKLLAVGDIEQWINSYCDGIRLCSNAPDLNNIREYRAAIQEKIASSCLKNGGESLHVDYVVGDPEVDLAVKIFLICEPNGPPRFYSLRRTVDYWFFISL